MYVCMYLDVCVYESLHICISLCLSIYLFLPRSVDISTPIPTVLYSECLDTDSFSRFFLPFSGAGGGVASREDVPEGCYGGDSSSSRCCYRSCFPLADSLLRLGSEHLNSWKELRPSCPETGGVSFSSLGVQGAGREPLLSLSLAIFL